MRTDPQLSCWLILERLDAPDLDHAHAGELLLPAVEAGFGDAHLADHLGHWRAALSLPQPKGDLLFRVARLLHGTDPPHGSNCP